MKPTLVILFSLALVALAADITLQWDANDPVEEVAGYRVYQSTNVAGTYLPIGSTNGTSFTVRGLTPGVYFFYVTASNLWGESLPSNTVKTPPPAGAVKKVVITKP